MHCNLRKLALPMLIRSYGGYCKLKKNSVKRGVLLTKQRTLDCFFSRWRYLCSAPIVNSPTSMSLTGKSNSTVGQSRVSWHGHTNLQYNTAEASENSAVSSRQVRSQEMQDRVNFGILFDIDGVLARGCNPLQAAKRMVSLLADQNGDLMVPVAFCTNSTGVAADKAKCLSQWLDINVSPEQVIPAQGPLSVFHKYHDKRALFVGQGKLHEIAAELGFTNIVTIDEVKSAFPLLDIVDHSNRAYIARNGIDGTHIREEFEPIEDLLLTGGYPALAPEGGFPSNHIPIIACNMDLVFMADACMPRFGHGAFLVCLESLYKKITNMDLEYTALIGKPSEITFRFAEHCIAKTAEKIGITKPIETLYIIGDNPEVDVYGANLYTKYIEDCVLSDRQGGPHSSRQVPDDYDFKKQTVTKCHSILVETGVYDPKIGRIEDQEFDVYHHGHRDFEADVKLRIPTMYCPDVYDGVLNVLERELGLPDHLNNNNNNDKSRRIQNVLPPNQTTEVLS